MTLLERARFMLQKPSLNVFFHFSSDIKKLPENKKRCCAMVKQMFGFWAFLLLRSILKKKCLLQNFQCRLCSFQQKEFDQLRSRQYVLTEFDNFPMNFTSHVISYDARPCSHCFDHQTHLLTFFVYSKREYTLESVSMSGRPLTRQRFKG